MHTRHYGILGIPAIIITLVVAQTQVPPSWLDGIMNLGWLGIGVLGIVIIIDLVKDSKKK